MNPYDNRLEERLKKAFKIEKEHATNQARQDMTALDVCRNQFTRLWHVELFHYSAILLREQGRIQHVVDHHATGPLKRELIWAALYPYLLDAGYRLPPPYAPGSTFPTHALTSANDESLIRPLDLMHFGVMPAVNVATGQNVALKIVRTRKRTFGAEELDVVRMLNAEPLRSHPDNIAVQLLDVVPFPTVRGQGRAADYHVLVTPRLRMLEVYNFPVTGAVLPLMRRSFRMLAFLHSIGISHGDIGEPNFLLTPGTHEIHLIDFELSRRFDLQRDPKPRVQWDGGAIFPPEIMAGERIYDPFSADVYCLADTWKCICPLPPDGQVLLKRMTSNDPALRPSAAECVAALEQCLARVSFLRRCMPITPIPYSIKLAIREGRYSTVFMHVRNYFYTLFFSVLARPMSTLVTR